MCGLQYAHSLESLEKKSLDAGCRIQAYLNRYYREHFSVSTSHEMAHQPRHLHILVDATLQVIAHNHKTQYQTI